MISTHLRKKNDPNKGYLYAYTDMLAMQPDMIPCDAKGNPVGVAGEVLGGGMRGREPEAPNKELEIALESIATLKAEIEKLKAVPDGDATGTELHNLESDIPEESVLGIDKMSRNELFDHLEEKYGEKANYLKGNMSKTTLLEEAEKLQAVADLASE